MVFETIADRLGRKRWQVYLLFWLLTFLIYLPAANAGFVSDTTGWLQSLRQDSFIDYINRTRFAVKSMYQLTQLNTWLLYRIIGAGHWAWHIVFISLHATACYLLYRFACRLFYDSKLARPQFAALAGSLLFCISPYHSEVVVWEASFHYPQAFILLFGILTLVQRFQVEQRIGLAVGGGIIFLAATFTHELWYLTLPLTVVFALYYYLALNSGRQALVKTLLYFTLPQCLGFFLHRYLFGLVYGGGVAHIGSNIFKNPPAYFYVKAPWYFFHLFAWGRFFPENIKRHVYELFRHPGAAVAFYVLMAVPFLVLLLRIRQLPAMWRVSCVLFAGLLLCIGIFVPLWFPESLLVVCDRYLYLMLAFQWLLLAVLISSLRRQWLQNGIWMALAGINLALAANLSVKWRRSDQVIAALQTSPLLKPGKIKLLLNSPACLRGIPMIGSSPEGEFRLMHNLLYAPPIKDSMLEVAAYNMDHWYDGAHVEVTNDSTVKVTLNQWGTWWWLGGFGAYSYENHYFRLDMVDVGHWYQVILKPPYSQYQLLYQQGKELKEVDMQRRGEQF